jgi:hypothetical protein
MNKSQHLLAIRTVEGWKHFSVPKEVYDYVILLEFQLSNLDGKSYKKFCNPVNLNLQSEPIDGLEDE